MEKLLIYFTDSVLRAPTIGCMLMCLTAALVGSFVVLRRKSLIGETLAHACYPGVIVALLLDYLLTHGEEYELISMLSIMIGAAISALLGMYTIHRLEKQYKVSGDAALSATLSMFFGVALLLLSALQQSYPTLYKELQAYLFGQVATMRDVHVAVYGALSSVVLVLIILYFREIQAVIFDPVFAELIGIKKNRIEALLFLMTVLAVVVGIRSCGVVLVSAMLIFPTVCARFFTDRLAPLLALAALFGICSGFFGVVLSHEASIFFLEKGQNQLLSFPTGPMIVVVAALFLCMTLLYSLSKKWRKL